MFGTGRAGTGTVQLREAPLAGSRALQLLTTIAWRAAMTVALALAAIRGPTLGVALAVLLTNVVDPALCLSTSTRSCDHV